MRGAQNPRKSPQRGATLVLTALALTALLSVMALAVDLGLLYIARSEAQRAADAAALAGASAFVTSGCTSLPVGCASKGPQEAPATTQAIAIGTQNSILDQPATVQPGNIVFHYPTPEEPQITVTVVKAGIPTIFARVFGNDFSTVSAEATAEAYNPTGGQAPTAARITPFLVPNCNPYDTGEQNPFCPNGAGYFIDSPNGPIQANALGEPWFLHFGAGPSDAATPSEWYMVAIWPGGNPSGAQMQAAIAQQTTVACNSTYPTVVGKKVGPLDHGVETLINSNGQSPCNASGNCNFSQGQDLINVNGAGSSDFGYTVTAGSNNTVFAPGSEVLPSTSSGSIVNAAIYDGAICGATGPGGITLTTSNSDCIGPGGGNVNVLGWMQLFIEGATHQAGYDGVEAIILNVSQCPTTSTLPTVVDDAGSPIPIRLIQHAN